MNLLFICSRNQWRSPTAERVWRNMSGMKVRSAGTSPKAKRTVSATDLQWADQIFVMENRHKKQLLQQFQVEMQFCSIHVLDIPDDYGFMDPILVELVESGVQAVLDMLS